MKNLENIETISENYNKYQNVIAISYLKNMSSSSSELKNDENNQKLNVKNLPRSGINKDYNELQVNLIKNYSF